MGWVATAHHVGLAMNEPFSEWACGIGVPECNACLGHHAEGAAAVGRVGACPWRACRDDGRITDLAFGDARRPAAVNRVNSQHQFVRARLLSHASSNTTLEGGLGRQMGSLVPDHARWCTRRSCTYTAEPTHTSNHKK